jgi:hypothetical protein
MSRMAAARPRAYSEPDLLVVTDESRVSTPRRELEPEHETTVVETGSFARASCVTCAWTGPARRARSMATVDLAEHLAAGGDR